MTSTPPSEPADDAAARFQQWIADVGPMQQHPDDLPPIEVGRPVVLAAALLAGLAAIVAALGWLAFWLAIGVGAATPGAIVLLAVGTLLVIVGIAFTFIGRPR